MRGEGPGGRPRWGACSGTGWLTPGAGGHQGPLPSSSSSPAPTGRPAPFQKNLYLKGPGVGPACLTITPPQGAINRAPTPALSSLRSSGRFAGSQKKCQGERGLPWGGVGPIA